MSCSKCGRDIPEGEYRTTHRTWPNLEAMNRRDPAESTVLVVCESCAPPRKNQAKRLVVDEKPKPP